MTRPIALAALTLLLSTGFATAQTTPDESQKVWLELKKDVVGDGAIKDGSDVIALDVPKRAQDAGLVPLDITLDPTKAGPIKKLTVVIDVNPSPVAAVFTFNPEADVQHISTRIRVNDYSYVRLIAETDKGELHMTEKFVKASGGCSAPAVKSPQEAKASLGVMKLKQFPPAQGMSPTRRDVQLMLRHPNNSGFQMDQITRNFIPPHFMHTLKVSEDGKLIFAMEGGISISEDPNFRFDYKTSGGHDIEAEAVDTEGLVFKGHWPLDVTGSAE